eukprot:8889140-Pyramimonas_sp.AAC.1
MIPGLATACTCRDVVPPRTGQLHSYTDATRVLRLKLRRPLSTFCSCSSFCLERGDLYYISSARVVGLCMVTFLAILAILAMLCNQGSCFKIKETQETAVRARWMETRLRRARADPSREESRKHMGERLHKTRAPYSANACVGLEGKQRTCVFRGVCLSTSSQDTSEL